MRSKTEKSELLANDCKLAQKTAIFFVKSVDICTNVWYYLATLKKRTEMAMIDHVWFVWVLHLEKTEYCGYRHAAEQGGIGGLFISEEFC